MILLYKVGLTSMPEESTFSLVDELMGVEACFWESSPNFLTMFLAQEKCELPHHTHLKFFLHLLKKFYSLMIDGSPKYYVINIYLSHKKVSFIILDKQSSVDISPFESSI